MSLRQIRRLLQQTCELATEHAKDGDEAREETTRRAKLKRKKNKPAQIPVDKEQVIRHQVNSLLLLDRKMASKDSKKNLTATRIRENHIKQRHVGKSTAKKTLGDTRSSSTELKKALIPTFNKKRYKKHQEEKRMAQIAKLLKKNSTASKSSNLKKKSK